MKKMFFKTAIVMAMASMSLSSLAQAHEHDHKGHDQKDHDGMKAETPVSGTSVLQLGSTWKNQKGESINLKDLSGSPRLVAMLFTRCQTACPLIVEDIKDVVKDIDSKRKGKKIDVSIFSIDSFRETPESLAAFATKRNIPAHWGLYASNGDAVAELAGALGVRYKRLTDGDFIHSNVIYFLNVKGEVVAQKEGIKTPRAEFLTKIRAAL